MEALVDSLMTKSPVPVDTDVTVVKAAGMLAGKSERCLVVVRDRIVVGVVTASDMIEKVIAAGANPSEVYVRDIMSTPVVTVSSKASIGDAAGLMSDYGVGKLPVIDDSGALVGVVTSLELARFLAKLNDFRDPALNALAKMRRREDRSPYR